MNPMRFFTVIAVLLAVALSTPALAEGGWVGKKAPDFEVTDTNGNSYKLSALAGDKVVWLNFWGLRCGPCVRELPALQKIYDKYKDRLTFEQAPQGQPFEELYDLDTLTPTAAHQALYDEVKEELIRLGVPLS